MMLVKLMCFLALLLPTSCKQIIHHFVLRDNPPYHIPAKYNEYNAQAGIIPDFIDNLFKGDDLDDSYQDYVLKTIEVNSPVKLQDIMESAKPHQKDNISINDGIIVSASSSPHLKSVKSFMKEIAIMSPGSAIIVRNSDALLLMKLFTGLGECFSIIYFATLSAVIVGAVVWLLEHRRNKEFPSTFGKGLWSGFWFSYVTMTTVGYGDKTPKHWATRIISMLWMVFAVLTVAMVTATVMSNASNMAELRNKKVAVFRNSFEATNVEKLIGADRCVYDSYLKLLSAVKNGEVEACLIDQNVAAFYFNRFGDAKSKNGKVPAHSAVHKLVKSLKVQQKIAKEYPIRIFVRNIKMNSSLGNKTSDGCCCGNHKVGNERSDLFLSQMITRYTLSLAQTTHYVRSVHEIFDDSDNGLILSLTITAGCLIAIGLVVELVYIFHARRKGKNHVEMLKNIECEQKKKLKVLLKRRCHEIIDEVMDEFSERIELTSLKNE